MGDPMIDRTIEAIVRAHWGNLPVMRPLISPNAVIDRFQRRPEKFLYFFGWQFVDESIGSKAYISLTLLDSYRSVSTPVRAMEDFDKAESASSGLFVGVVVPDRVLLVMNPLTGHQARIGFPQQVNADDQFGPVQISVNEADATYVMWFCAYYRPDPNTYMFNIGMFLYRSATECWTTLLAGPTIVPDLYSKDGVYLHVLVIDRDVSAYVMDPDGGYYFKFGQGGHHSHGPITQPLLPVAYFHGPWSVPKFIHFAFIAGEVWAFQADVMHCRVNGPAQQVCFLYILRVDDFADVTVEQQQQQYPTRRMRWIHRHRLLDDQLLALVFDPAGDIGTVNEKRFLVTADSHNFFVCARDDSLVLRVSPLGGRVDAVVDSGDLPRTRENVFAVTASFIAPLRNLNYF